MSPLARFRCAGRRFTSSGSAFQPLAVDEKYRGQGLARQLVYEGLDSLNEFATRRS